LPFHFDNIYVRQLQSGLPKSCLGSTPLISCSVLWESQRHGVWTFQPPRSSIDLVNLVLEYSSEVIICSGCEGLIWFGMQPGPEIRSIAARWTYIHLDSAHKQAQKYWSSSSQAKIDNKMSCVLIKTRHQISWYTWLKFLYDSNIW